ncbi:transposase, partial [Maridesulfovibrio bastinii]
MNSSIWRKTCVRYEVSQTRKMLQHFWKAGYLVQEHPISSGPMEGTNNKIKTMKRQAYGYRDL